jgi:hypothetical protein
MGDKKKVIIYHLYRHDDTSLFLHPFNEGDKTLDAFENAEVIGKYGKEPRVEAFTMFRNELYRIIEDRVNSWVSEVRFIPKFLISAGVFIAAYFILALVFRDPLPMIDEIAIGLGISIGVFFLLGRRDRRSDMSLKKRVALRSMVDKIVFREDPFVKEVEDTLQSCETESRDDIIEDMFDPLKCPLNKGEQEDALRLTAYMKKQFKSRELKRKEKIVYRLTKARKGGRTAKILSLLADTKKTDLPLFAVYTKIKKSCETVDSEK